MVNVMFQGKAGEDGKPGSPGKMVFYSFWPIKIIISHYIYHHLLGKRINLS